MNRIIAATLIVVLLALLPTVAMAQALTCTQTPTNGGGFRLDCKPVTTPTRTPTRTPTWTPTSTPMPPTPTPVPPTATAAPSPVPTVTALPISPTPTPTASPSRPSPTPVSGRRVNVPLLNAAAGDPALDANNWSFVWLGKVVDSSYAGVRLVGADEGLRIRAQMIDDHAAPDDAIVVAVNGVPLLATYGDPAAPWVTAGRCTGDACRGWSATATVPWAQLGGRPQQGDTWPLRIERNGYSWDGTLHWGLPDYGGINVPGSQVVTVPLTADAGVGGGTDCGLPDWPEYFGTWGNRNWGSSPYAIIQNQWDIADWPCYAKHLVRWQLPALPAGAQVVSATLTMYHFGDPGYGSGYAPDGSGETVHQIYEINGAWDEMTVGWDSLPLAGENVSRLNVLPVPDTCVVNNARYCDPPLPVTFDVSELVRRAAVAGRTDVSALLATAAGQYHSGKQMWTRETTWPPKVRIAYVLDSVATPTQTPAPTEPATATPVSPTAAPTATATPQPSATATATPTRQPAPTPLPTAQPSTPTATPIVGVGKTIYVAPSQSFPWSSLLPGDTLILRDGVYRQSMIPTVSGTADRPITIKAEHDGKAIIDGEGKRAVFETGHSRPGTGNNLVVEGIVGRNSAEDVFFIRSDNVTLRRVSGYNADVDDNSSVFTFWTRGGGLLEDCLASGTGRKMILLYQSDNVTVRRCFTRWQQWDGRAFCGVLWPNAETVQVYNGNSNTFENIVATGPSPVWLIAVQSNSDAAIANNNRVLGSIAAGAGMAANGSAYNYGARPQPTSCGDTVRSFDWPNQRAGVMLWGQGTMQNNVFRDILTTGNAALGFSYDRPYGAGATGTVVDHLTAYGNGKYAPAGDGGAGTQAKFNGIVPTNSCIGAATCANGGARLANRYVDGVLTNEPLWPWPMDSRAVAEMGLSITDWATQYVRR